MATSSWCFISSAMAPGVMAPNILPSSPVLAVNTSTTFCRLLASSVMVFSSCASRSARRWRKRPSRRRPRTVFRPPAAIIEELERLHHDAEFAPLLAGLFIFPGIEPQAAFDHDRPAFFHVLTQGLRLAAESVHVHERYFFL